MTDGQTNKASVVVLGTGIMGSAIARSLLRAGLNTVVWNRSGAATATLAEAGARAAATAREAVRDARVVITMLPTAEVVRAVMPEGGVVEELAKGAVWVQMGTIGVLATLETAARVRQIRPDVLFVDAPVSGSKGPAARGQLVILASGPHEAASIVEPAFSAIGRKTVRLGDAGQGSRMKLVINAYLAILVEGVAETLELADRFGIDHRNLAEAIEGGEPELFTFIERYYNQTRLHSHNRYKTPNETESPCATVRWRHKPGVHRIGAISSADISS